MLRTPPLTARGSASEFLSHCWAECGLLRVLTAAHQRAAPCCHHSNSSCQGRWGLPPLPSPSQASSALQPLEPRERLGGPPWSEPVPCPAKCKLGRPRCTPPSPRGGPGTPGLFLPSPRPASPVARHAVHAHPRGGGDECQPAGTDGAWRFSRKECRLHGHTRPGSVSASAECGEGAEPSHRVGRGKGAESGTAVMRPGGGGGLETQAGG